jgi:hypothetical protein
MEIVFTIMMVFLAFTVCAACTAISFLVIDMMFSHRISVLLSDWIDRKFKVE